VNIFVQDTEQRARAFLERYPVGFPSGHDWDLAIANAVGFKGMPYTVLFSRHGDVVQKFFGPVAETDLVRGIEKALAAP
jgi:hypothetical protein